MANRKILLILLLFYSMVSAFTSKDSAYVPIKVNANVTVVATPIQMIKGAVLDEKYEIDLIANKSDTLKLPVITDNENSIAANSNDSKFNSIYFLQNERRILLKLPSEYLNGTLTMHSLNGRLIAKRKLIYHSEVSLSVWGLASGIYVIQVEKGDYYYSKKINMTSGNLNIKTNISNSSILKNRNTNNIRSDKALYELKIKSSNINFRDTVFEISLFQEINPEQVINLNIAEGQDTPITELMDSSTYDLLFKHRYGINGTPGDYDFYSYKSFIEALKYLSDFEATVYSKNGAGGDRMIVRRKSTNNIHEYITTAGYYDVSGEEVEHTVDYGNFFNEGNIETRKQELCAYLANAAQETYGGWDNAPGGKYSYGLYWIHEAYPIYNETSKDDRFTENHSVYGTPETLEWSYHGRGPKQITYNYNYGMLSDFIYFDKMVLLDDPNIIAREPFMAWVSSLWYWMTPQGRKPSCHDVMVGNWEPTVEDISAGRATSKFGMTINIINGGVECGANNEGNIRALGRKGHYEYFCDYFKITPENNCTCHQMNPY